MNKIIIRNLNSGLKNHKSSKSIRKDFVDFFTQDLNHKFIRSSPVIPLNDPTIPFVNAGMNQFKGVLLGIHNPPAPRVANSQKCIRIGGKHNDLNVIGKDSYHHTFFEMLGNWSFGDYFKKEACEYAWTLLTEVYGIKKEFLYVTYFAGNEKLELKPDLECKEIWLNLGVRDDHILPFGMEENFWEMGPSGPCGPCTEIHIDHTMQATSQANRINKGFSDLSELWNIVFVQFQRLKDERIIPLNKQHVDTGMGFERLVALLQGKRSNYDTDLFQPIIRAIESHSKAPAYKGKFGTADKNKLDTAYRILSDHARMITVALADGVLPDKNHKFRKVLRNAIDIGEEYFKSKGIVSELMYHVSENLSDVYPEIGKNLSQIKHIVTFEEEMINVARATAVKNWQKIVDNKPELSVIPSLSSPSLCVAYSEIENLKRSGLTTLSGELSFKMYDSYGLSIDVISQLAKIESLDFDPKTFYDEMKKVKEKSRLGSEKTDDEVLSEYSLNILESSKIPKTDDSFKYDYFFKDNQYHFPPLPSTLLGIVVNGILISEPQEPLNIDESQAIVEATVTSSGKIVEINSVINSKIETGIILDKTSAYTFAGSQVSDRGQIKINNLVFQFEKVRKIRDYIIHIGYFVDWNEVHIEEEIHVGDRCLVCIDPDHRIGSMRHHTAAHLLHAALKKILPATGQRGADVARDMLSFECSIFGKKLSLKNIEDIENFVNGCIRRDVPVKTKTVNLLEMLEEDDLSFIPGEVYPDTGIRVIEINDEDLKSKEPCCGTHVHSTGMLDDFCIVNVKPLGKASVCIKAVAGPAARLARSAGIEMAERVKDLEQELKIGEVNTKIIELKLKKEKRKLSEHKYRTRYRYVEAQTRLKKIEDLLKIAKMKLRKEEKLENEKKNPLEQEIREMMSDISVPFLVRCLQPSDTSLENIWLQNIMKLCPHYLPAMIIAHCKDKVKARCYVPENSQSDNFNAQIWMSKVLEIFESNGEAFEDEDPRTAYNMQPVEVSNDVSQELIEKAMETAAKFAVTHVKSSRTNNKDK